MLFCCALICVALAGLTTSRDLVLALPTHLGDALDITDDLTILQKDCSPSTSHAIETLTQLPSQDNQSAQGQVSIVIVNSTIWPVNRDRRITPVRDDYTYVPGIGYYKLHTMQVVWNEARKTCKEEGGHLAIINSVAEEQVLTGIIKGSNRIMKDSKYDKQTFIGIHDLFAEGEWVTVFGDSLAKTGYTGWTDNWGGQPDNSGGNENCGTLWMDGGLNDMNCNSRHPFLCELPLIHAE